MVLLVSALLIWRAASGFDTNFAVLRIASKPRPASPSTCAKALPDSQDKLRRPEQWTFSGRSGLFVPEKHFIGPNDLPATLQTVDVHLPVPNAWFEQFSLPIEDNDILDEDADGDGFSNVDEWHGHTNPIDQNSHPDYVTRLRLKSVHEEPFHLLFSAWVNDTFQINTVDFAEPTQFLKLGDIVAGTQFKIITFKERHGKDRYGTDVDVSELILENVETNNSLTLVREQVAVSPESVAAFGYTWPAGSSPREFQIRKDQEFSLQPNEEVKYKLIDAHPTKVVIVNTQRPDQRIEIAFSQ